MNKVILAALPIALALAVSGCQKQSDAEGGNPTQVSIMVGGLDKVIYLPAELTDRLGYFKEQGLTVKLQSQPPGRTPRPRWWPGRWTGWSGSTTTPSTCRPRASASSPWCSSQRAR